MQPSLSGTHPPHWVSGTCAALPDQIPDLHADEVGNHAMRETHAGLYLPELFPNHSCMIMSEHDR